MTMRNFSTALATFGALLLAGCGTETVVHSLNEKEANTIVEVMADSDITATKIMNATGREVVYDIAVPAAQRLGAIKVLNKNELPRRRDKGYDEVFAGGGLIPTAAEEKAKKLAALEGEIERQLKLIEGVLDVQVQVVMPEESSLRTTQEQEPTTTASVTIRYLPGVGGARPVSEPEVQAIVAAGVEKLMPENVVVLMRPAGPPPQATAAPAKLTGLAVLGNKALTIGLVALLLIIALEGAGVIAAQVRLRTVRGRLIKLQNEIAKARSKKPGELAGASASQAAAVSQSNTAS
jgi:type III secretion protein J